MLDTMVIATGALLLVIVGSASFLVVYFRDLQYRRAPFQHQQTDLANMLILFQTMRDVVSEQKDLARRFNESLDKKVAEVRSLVEEAKTEREAMNRMERSMVANADPGSAALDTPAVPPSYPQATVGAEPTPSDDPEDDLIDAWTGLDFGGDEPHPQDFDVPDELPQEPEDPAMAREAFRSLLSLDPTPGGMSFDEPGGLAPSPQGGDNGREDVTPLQRRVYEYSDAGMSDGEISKELGVGRGEVRLIRNLRGKAKEG